MADIFEVSPEDKKLVDEADDLEELNYTEPESEEESIEDSEEEGTNTEQEEDIDSDEEDSNNFSVSICYSSILRDESTFSR